MEQKLAKHCCERLKEHVEFCSYLHSVHLEASGWEKVHHWWSYTRSLAAAEPLPLSFFQNKSLHKFLIQSTHTRFQLCFRFNMLVESFSAMIDITLSQWPFAGGRCHHGSPASGLVWKIIWGEPFCLLSDLTGWGCSWKTQILFVFQAAVHKHHYLQAFIKHLTWVAFQSHVCQAQNHKQCCKATDTDYQERQTTDKQNAS